MKQFKALLLANAVIYLAEAVMVWAWITFWPFSFWSTVYGLTGYLH